MKVIVVVIGLGRAQLHYMLVPVADHKHALIHPLMVQTSLYLVVHVMVIKHVLNHCLMVILYILVVV